MIDLNPDIVCAIIRKAAQFHAKEEVVIPNEPQGPSDSSMMQVLADHRNDATFSEMHAAINDLEPDQQATLVTIMLIGRGDFDASEWDEAYAQACTLVTPQVADYLIATPLIADYLDEGLDLLGYSCS